jgi:hypothetical protein
VNKQVGPSGGADPVESFRSRRGVRASGRGCPAMVAVWSLAAFALCFAAPMPARAGVAFGVRGGYADVDGNAFVGSGKIGGTPLIGLQAILPVVPLISLVVAGEQRTKSFDFTSPTIGTLRAEGRAKWTDRTLYAAARVRVPGVVGLYGGAGLGMHMRKTDLSGVVRTTGAGKTDAPASAGAGESRVTRAAIAGGSLDDFLSRAEKEATDLSWHAFAGMEFSIPVVPVAVFAEGRVDDIQGSDPRSLAAYVGVNLKLP